MLENTSRNSCFSGSLLSYQVQTVAVVVEGTQEFCVVRSRILPQQSV